MTTIVSPSDENELVSFLADRAAASAPVAVIGGGTRAGLGRPVAADTALSTAKLAGITLYEPSELVLSARAGTPLAEVEAALEANGQRLAFEPMDHRGIYRAEGAPTVGGVAAANVSGPRRIEAGAARDGMIGVHAVTGRGEAIKTGGRVMKNVVGYDLVKFLAGSYGTLAVMTEVTFKLAPTPETERTLALAGLDLAGAVAAMSKALGSPWGISGAAHLPAEGGAPSRTVVRLEGFERSVIDRISKLGTRIGGGELLDPAESAALWASIRDVAGHLGGDDGPLWRVSVKPGDAPALVEALAGTSFRPALYDWGGGLVWLLGGEGADAGAATLRAALEPIGGHATLMRAPEATRSGVAVFQPLAPALMTLSANLKRSFDPAGILNPGRMYEGV